MCRNEVSEGRTKQDYCKVARQSSMLDEATESAGSEYGKYLAVVSVQAALSCQEGGGSPVPSHVMCSALQSPCLIIFIPFLRSGCWQH